LEKPMDVLIVEPLDADVMAWLSARYAVRLAPELAQDPPAFAWALGAVRALVVPPSLTINAATLQRAPQLRFVGRLSAGAENIDIDACARAGVEVVRPASANAPAEAEFAIGAMLQMLRRMPIINSDGFLVGRELGHCTVGVVGLTPATKHLSRLLSAFGAKVLGHDPGLQTADSLWQHAGAQPVGLSELLAQSDAVCVLLSFFPRYAGLLTDALLRQCKRHQVLLCLSSAHLFQESALARAMTAGPLSAAWFDQMDPAWLMPGRPLYQLDTLQTTPRISGTTQQSRARSAWALAGRMDELLRAPPAAPSNELGGFRPSQPGALAGLEDE
jgi:D-3-phosphoglycerate dehydrogenase / 2-oxoglutarate reductase